MDQGQEGREGEEECEHARRDHRDRPTNRQTEQPHADHLFPLLSLPGKLDAELLPTMDSLTPFQSPVRSTNRLFKSGREQGGLSGFLTENAQTDTRCLFVFEWAS